MNIWQLLFSINGRINRKGFWQGLSICISLLFVLVLCFPMEQLFANSKTALYASAPLLLVIYCFICVSVKRLHDRGRSGATIPILIMPILCYFISQYSEGIMAWFLGQFFPIFFSVMFILDWGIFLGHPEPNRFGEKGLSLKWKK